MSEESRVRARTAPPTVTTYPALDVERMTEELPIVEQQVSPMGLK